MASHHLNHLAIIMDGNARWAKFNNKTRAQGHKEGAKTAKNIMISASKLGVKYLTLYAFSSENWQRSSNEISILVNLLTRYITKEIQTLNDHQIRLKMIGDFTKLSNDLREKIDHAVENTKNNSKMTIVIAFSYGARNEIINACQKAINSGMSKITEETFQKLLYDPKMPDVDMLIRSSGLYRVSNFLLWQIAYAELYFVDKFWPDFNENDLKLALDNFVQRNRTFGTR